ncbi:MAG: hypothetical protein QNL88_15260 [Acidobacteriota bacterium]|nr:hypothetical protein [Acidobacteriota bacterium]
MVRLLPPTPDSPDSGLRDVIERALEAGASEPVWIAVDDASRRWLPLVAACPIGERAHGVVIAQDDAALLLAHKLGVGGAAAMPASTPGVADALRAASRGSRPPLAIDPGVTELFDGVPELKVASFSNRAFWRAQLGDRVLSRLLAELAIGLRTPPAVVPWPALILADRSERQILDAWQPLAAGAGRPADDLVVSEVAPGGRGVAASVYSALLEQVEHIRAVKTVSVEPVYELPSGKLIGWWASEPGPKRPGEWVAAPVEISGPTCRWGLVGGGEKSEVEDVLEVDSLNRLEGVTAVRVPGSLTGGLRSGTPAGLLVQRLAEVAARRGLPLWLPNVDTEALRFALRLPGSVWVDGPAVPR